MNALSSATLLAVLGLSSTAMAQHSSYCALEDKLVNWTLVTGRNAWARKCGFISQAKQLFLNEEGEYQIFLEGCYSFPNVLPASFCRRYVPVSESEACIPLNELSKLGTCAFGYSLAGKESTEGSPGEAAEEVFSFKLANGRDLDVPASLLLVDGEGNLVKARTLAPGDELLGSDGQKVFISDIRVSRFQGYIWDFLPVSPSSDGDFMDVGGLLMGSSRAHSRWDDVNHRLALREGADVQAL